MRIGALVLLVALASPARSAEVTATWTASPGATGYTLATCSEHPTSPGAVCTVRNLGDITTAPLTVTLGQAIYVCVGAYNAAGPSPFTCRWLSTLETPAVRPLYQRTDVNLSGMIIGIASNLPAHGFIHPAGRAALPQMTHELARRLEAAAP